MLSAGQNRNTPSLKLLDRVIIDAKVGAPLHHQVRRTLRKLIEEHFDDGALLWPETVLVEHLRISRGTVRQALSQLAREGLLVRHPAKGTFVRKKPAQSTSFSTIGVFVSQYNSDLLSMMLEQISRAARDRGLRAQVYHTFHGEDTAQAYQQVERPPEDEGLVFMTTPSTTFELYNALNDRGYRTVSIEVQPDDYEGGWVATDAAQAVTLGIDHLAALGHRRIVFLANEPVQEVSVAQKITRFEAEVQKRGLSGTVIDCGIELWQSSFEAAYRKMEEVWALVPRPTAIFTASDPGAWAVLKWLAQRHIAVPDAVSVLGFENVSPSQYTHPALTTVAHSFSDIAGSAVTMLLEGVRAQRLFAPTLVVRESTGAAPQRDDAEQIHKP